MSVSKISSTTQTKPFQENSSSSRKILPKSDNTHIVIPKLKSRATKSAPIAAETSSKKAQRIKDRSNGPKETLGTVCFADGSKYKGQLTAHIPHGLGFLTFANGCKYEGEFEYGLMQGIGIFNFPNGDIYRGSFEKGKFHGLGRYIFADGRPDLAGMFSNGTFLL